MGGSYMESMPSEARHVAESNPSESMMSNY